MGLMSCRRQVWLADKRGKLVRDHVRRQRLAEPVARLQVDQRHVYLERRPRVGHQVDFPDFLHQRSDPFLGAGRDHLVDVLGVDLAEAGRYLIQHAGLELAHDLPVPLRSEPAAVPLQERLAPDGQATFARLVGGAADELQRQHQVQVVLAGVGEIDRRLVAELVDVQPRSRQDVDQFPVGHGPERSHAKSDKTVFEVAARPGLPVHVDLDELPLGRRTLERLPAAHRRPGCRPRPGTGSWKA